MFSKEVWDSQLMWDYVWQIVPALILPQKLHVGIWLCLGLGLLAKFSSTTHMNTLSRLNQPCLEAQSRINFLWCWDRTLEPWIQIPWGFLIFFCLRASYRHKFCITLLSNRLNETFERKNQNFQCVRYIWSLGRIMGVLSLESLLSWIYSRNCAQGYKKI